MAAGRMAGDPLPGSVSRQLTARGSGGTALGCGDQHGRKTMARRRLLGPIAILLVTGALLGASAAEARSRRPPRPPRPPRSQRCHPGTVCRGGTGVCNDAGRCCNTSEGDVACGSDCCEFGTQACCGGKTCVNVLEDDNNCGGCGNVCTGGKSCQNGSCACSNGDTDCSGVCTNPLVDDANCGACGDACAADQKCFLGTCGCQDATQLYCDGLCLDGFSDPNNCGACHNVCPADQDCIGGSCQAPCGPCEERVNNLCVPKDTGDIPCCEWQGAAHYCAAGQQCAGSGCCSAGDEVCLGNGTAQCCNGGFVCQAGRCCLPQSYPQCDGPGCCWWPH